MTRKLHTKLAFNKDSHFLSNIKSIGAYSLLVSFFALFTITVSITPAQAEPAIQITISNVDWVNMPIFRMGSHCLNTVSTGANRTILLGVLVDQQGKITSLQVKKSSGNRCLDRSAIQQAKSGRIKPVMVEGQAVRASFSLPIRFVVP